MGIKNLKDMIAAIVIRVAVGHKAWWVVFASACAGAAVAIYVYVIEKLI